MLYIAEKEMCRVFVFCRSIVGFKGFDEREREFSKYFLFTFSYISLRQV